MHSGLETHQWRLNYNTRALKLAEIYSTADSFGASTELKIYKHVSDRREVPEEPKCLVIQDENRKSVFLLLFYMLEEHKHEHLSGAA